MRDGTILFRGSPSRNNREGPESTVPYSSTSTLLQEISSLRIRLKDLEDDTKSSIAAGAIDEHEAQLSILLRKDIANLEQEKANAEKDFLNQLSTLAAENQKRVYELEVKLTETEKLNFELQETLRSTGDKDIDSTNPESERHRRMMDELRDKHAKEMEQMKVNIASSDIEIAESRGEIDSLHEKLDELQSYRETLIEEVTGCKMDLTEEQRKLSSIKADMSKTQITVEKLQKEVKTKDQKIEQKMLEISKYKKDVDELKGGRKELEIAMKKIDRLEKELHEKDSTLDQKNDEIGEMNDTIIDLQGHKEMLMAEVTDLKMDLQKIQDVRNATKTTEESRTMKNLPAVDKEDSSQSISSTVSRLEKQKLEDDMNILATQLKTVQKQLEEKDCQLEILSNSLAEEKRLNKHLKTELKSLSLSASNMNDSFTTVGGKDNRAELSYLRNQNKMLSDEICMLKASESRGGTTDPKTKVRSVPSAMVFEIEEVSSVTQRKPPSVLKSKKGLEASQNPMLPPSLERVAGVSGSNNGPRTPVSGIVASFERRIAGKNQSLSVSCSPEDEIPSTESNDRNVEDSELKQKLYSEKQYTVELERQLKEERVQVEDLKKKLEERALDKESTNSVSPDHIKLLQKSQRDVRKLQQKVNELEEIKVRHGEELDKLRAEMVYVDVEREDLENKILDSEKEIKRLSTDLENLNNTRSMRGERQVEEYETSDLREQLRAKEDDLQRLHDKLQQVKKQHDEITTSLRKQLLTKEEEHKDVIDIFLKEDAEKDIEIKLLKDEVKSFTEHKDQNISKLLEEIDSLNEQLSDALKVIKDRNEAIEKLRIQIEEVQGAKSNPTKESEIANLNAELLELKAKHEEIGLEYTKSIKDLEDKINALELNKASNLLEIESLKSALVIAEQKIDNEIAPSLQKNIDEERESLTVELAKTQMRYAELEMEHTTRIKEMEGEMRTIESRRDQEKVESQNSITSLQALVNKLQDDLSPKTQKAHDCEINKITVELTKTQMKQADLEREYSNRVRDLELEIEDLEVEAEEELKQKDREIEELTKSVKVKEEEIKRLEKERSHLCTSLSDMSFSRKDEIHELQAEVIDLSTKTKSQERDIQALKMKLQDYENQVDDSSQKYQQRISELEEEIYVLKRKSGIECEPEAISIVHSENLKLRECVRELKMERRSLNERLEVLMMERNGSKSSQILQKRNIALKQQVEKLTKRLHKLEASITRFAI